MQLNPSYIFFRPLQGPGPVGAQGVVLTPGRSLAVDRRFIPLGAPIWLATTSPLDSSEALNRLVIAQDTGSAIKGPVRGDLYWGHGENAALNAGFMKSSGRYYILLPKPPRPAKAR
jgi:membrane-bound lytic murein transglycosylase A